MPARVNTRDEWARIGFVLAAIGAAVGVGNIWRFPYMVGINGGGAFFIPYLIGVILFSLPLMILELDSGREFRGSVSTTLRQVNKTYRLSALVPILISVGVAGYYLVVTGWSFAYFVFSLTGYVSFYEFTGSLLPLLFFLVSILVVGAIVSRGIKNGIERMAMILMPIFFALLIGLATYSLTLPGAGQGVAFYLNPDFSALSDINIWVMGIVQAFFSLAVGYGILLTYGSYLKKKTRVTKYAFGIAGADTLIAFIGGLIVFPIVFTFNLDPGLGSGLTFISLPMVFETIPFGMLIGSAFFLLLFVAGLTSAVSFIEVPVSSLVDERRWKRIKAAALIGALVVLIGIPASLSFYMGGINVMGLPLLEWLDMFFGELLLLSAALTTLVITHSRVPGLFTERLRINRNIYLLLKWVIPPVLLLILVLNLIL